MNPDEPDFWEAQWLLEYQAFLASEEQQDEHESRMAQSLRQTQKADEGERDGHDTVRRVGK